MKVLVTGAAGFIGSHTCEALVARGHEVIAVDSFDGYLYPSEAKRGNAAALAAAVDGTRFALHELDICDAAAMRALAENARPDAILHLAALAGVRPSLAEPLRYWRTNVEGTGVILELCRELGIERLAFASSSSVYGARAAPGEDLAEVAAFREDDPCLRPASPYAASKRAGELQCSTYRDLYGTGVSALRFFTVFGPRQRPDMAIAKFLGKIARGETITLFGDGGSRRDYTFIDDIVAGTVAATERVEPGRYALYNLGGTVTTSLAELVAILEQVTGLETKVEHAPMQPGDVPVTFADVSRAAADLDYRPTTSVADGVAAQWQWMKQRGLA